MANPIAAINKADIPLRYLTKSLLRTALKCPRKLVYATNPTLYPRSRAKLEDPLSKHLSQEGDRFGEYCKQLFPHGIEVGKDVISKLDGTEKTKNVASKPPTSLDHLVAQTHQLLTKGNHDDQHIQLSRTTVFEGAIQHGLFYVRPDIIDKIVKPGPSISQTELRVIEVKSKSWDSRNTVESIMWTANKKSIRSTWQTNIQDIAFQTMVAKLAYPDVQVSSWLMMPDRAKEMKFILGHDSLDSVPTVDDTVQTIDGSIASLLNVDELVEMSLSSEVKYPGSRKGQTLKDAAHQWSEQMNDEDFSFDSFPTPIGTQCTSCEYRLKDPPERAYSGFDQCWQNATGMAKEEVRKPLILDLHSNTKKSIEGFLSEGKHSLSDLGASDFGLLENGTPLKGDANTKKKRPSRHVISKDQRQWYQVQTSQRKLESDHNHHHPNVTIRWNSLAQAMQKWQYPLHFIDFENCSPVIPYYSDASPYEVFAFQFSHHILSQKDDGTLDVQHSSEFLHAEPGISPNKAFLKALHNAIGDVPTAGGTVFQWSPHENTVLKAMLSSPEVSTWLSPEEISSLSAMRGSMVDLCKLAQKYYYVDGSGGSSSIKRLLKPTLNASSHLKEFYGAPTYKSRNFDDFQWYQLDESGHAKDPYDILLEVNSSQHASANNVTAGGAAASAFHELQIDLDLNEQDRKAIESSLLRYCELDTLAMVMIVQAWQGFLEDRK